MLISILISKRFHMKQLDVTVFYLILVDNKDVPQIFKKNAK